MTIHISISQIFKKIYHLLNKNKIKILLSVISLIVFISLLFRVGILTPSKSSYIWYFETHKNDFELIINYFDKVDTPYYILWNDLKDLHKIDDTSVKQSIIKILYFGNFSSVDGNRFLCSNLIDRVGEPIAIVYDSTHDNKEWSEEYWAEGDAYIKYSYAYEPLGDNWYYNYRNR